MCGRVRALTGYARGGVCGRGRRRRRRGDLRHVRGQHGVLQRQVAAGSHARARQRVRAATGGRRACALERHRDACAPRRRKRARRDTEREREREGVRAPHLHWRRRRRRLVRPRGGVVADCGGQAGGQDDVVDHVQNRLRGCGPTDDQPTHARAQLSAPVELLAFFHLAACAPRRAGERWRASSVAFLSGGRAAARAHLASVDVWVNNGERDHVA